MLFLFFGFPGNYQKALEAYKDIHRKFPENVECNSSRPSHTFSRTLDQLQTIGGSEGNENRAVDLFFPGLRFLVRLSSDMGLKELQDYANRLKKAEKMKEIREQVSRSASSRLTSLLGYYFLCNWTSGSDCSFWGAEKKLRCLTLPILSKKQVSTTWISEDIKIHPQNLTHH